MGLLRRALCAGIGVILACQMGCGQKSAKLSGKVTLNSKSLVWGTVNLQSEDEKAYQGQIQPDGSYEIDKVPLGKYAIMIFSPEPVSAKGRKKKDLPPQAEQNFKKKEELREKWFAIPAKYGDYAESGLSVTVDQSITPFDIRLTD